MRLSHTLKLFIDDRFTQWITLNTLRKERAEDREKRKSEQKIRERQKSRDLRHLSKLRESLTEKQYQSLRQQIEDKYRRILIKEGTSTQNPLKSCASEDFNNFLCCCFYMIKKETQVEDAKIYVWLEQFLKDKNYKMSPKKHYDSDSIGQRIQYHHKALEPWLRGYFENLYEHIYIDFLSKNLTKLSLRKFTS